MCGGLPSKLDLAATQPWSGGGASQRRWGQGLFFFFSGLQVKRGLVETLLELATQVEHLPIRVRVCGFRCRVQVSASGSGSGVGLEQPRLDEAALGGSMREAPKGAGGASWL